MKTRMPLTMTSMILSAAAVAQGSGDPVRGKIRYQDLCSACHSIQYNGTGPAHEGLFGRKAGGREGFHYADALKNSTLLWNERTLDTWLADPEQAVPGQKMGAGLADAQDRADLSLPT